MGVTFREEVEVSVVARSELVEVAVGAVGAATICSSGSSLRSARTNRVLDVPAVRLAFGSSPGRGV